MLEHVQVDESTLKHIRVLGAYLHHHGHLFSIAYADIMLWGNVTFDADGAITTVAELRLLKFVSDSFVANFDQMEEDRLPKDKMEARANYARAATLSKDLKRLLDLVDGEEDTGSENNQ